jgi:hypothetical protein
MATRGNTKKPSTQNRLAEIVAYRRSQGGSVTGSLAGGIKERLKEKFDPRKLLDQKGLLTALFPGLKAYSAKTAAAELSKSSMQVASFDEIKPTLETIAFNTKMTAKNTMVLPALHRDVNVIRQNIVKLIKLKGGDARTKADMYFMKAKEREDKYERDLKKERVKRDNTQKLKDDEEKNNKGMIGKIITVMINGLKTIVSAIINLGKAIVGAFKFIADVIIETMTSAIGLILKPLKLLGGILKDFIGDFFKNRLLLLLVSSIVKGTISSVFGLLFSKKNLVRLGYFLLGVFATTFGLQWAAEKFREVSMTESGLSESDTLKEKTEAAKKSSENYKSLLKTAESKSTLPYKITDEEFQELKTSKILPQNANREATVGRQAGYAGKQMQVSDGMFTDIIPGVEEHGAYKQSALFNAKAYQDYYKLKNKGLYKVPVPGLKDPLTLLLTKEEASEFGKKTVLYDLTMEALKNEASQKNPDEGIINGLIRKLNGIKSEMAEKSLNLVEDQYSPEYKEYDLVKKSLTILKDLSQSPSMLGLAAESVLKLITDSDIYKEQQKAFGESVDKFIADKNLSSFDNLSIDSATIDQLRGKIENRYKEFQAQHIMDRTNENQKQFTSVKQPIIINTENQSKKSSPYDGLGTPASAWNNDFIDKYFSGMMSNPLGPFRN